MANNNISSVSRGVTSSLPQVKSSTSERAAVSAASGKSSGSGTSSGGSSSASRQQVLNVDGQSLNPNARRGTYLNIVV